MYDQIILSGKVYKWIKRDNPGFTKFKKERVRHARQMGDNIFRSCIITTDLDRACFEIILFSNNC